MEEVLKEIPVKTKWSLDPVHSKIGFSVKHLRIANVRGEFKKMRGEITANGKDLTNAKVRIHLDPSSISTNDETRDKHLIGKDFFDVENYTDISFESISFTQLDDEDYELRGLLNMKGKSKEIILDVDFGGIAKDQYGKERAGFSAKGTINRKDWGLMWNTALDGGGFLLSDQVKLNVEAEFVRGE